MDVSLSLQASDVRVHVNRAHVACALGRPLVASLEIGAATPLEPEALVGTPALVQVFGEASSGVYQGIVTTITAVATSHPDAQRRYRLEVRSVVDALRLASDARIFRKKNAVDIVKEVVASVGISGDAFAVEVADPPPVREHVTQWREDHLAFVTRLMEEDGLYFRFDPKEGFDTLVLSDTSSSAPAELGEALRFIDASAQQPGAMFAVHPRRKRQRAPGKVATRDYDPANPALALEGKAEGGTDAEKNVEVYRSPGRFKDEASGKREARLRLEALRAQADVLSFDTTAYALRPGVAFEANAEIAVGPAPSGKFFVVETTLDWSHGDRGAMLHVRAIPLETPFRLARVTPHPKVSGILSANVTGASGEEIHTDAAACVKVKFDWDRAGPDDENASLPVRVMQANLPGSMLVPRVGWEVHVGFEDGDPDRPYVLGRSFNGKQLPPFSLPANKTITALGTVSSPGGAKNNTIHIDDAAGRQHMVWSAGFGKTTNVATNMNLQTVGFENTTITGSQSTTISGNETVSVSSAWKVGVGSQTAVVAGDQTLTLNATASTVVGSESVAIGGSLFEKVGSPAGGLGEFVKAAAIAGAGEIPVVGPFLSKGATWAGALYNGYKNGGMAGLKEAAGQTAVGEIAGQIPGGDAIVAAADGAGLTPWSEKAKERAAAQEGGGGGTGPGGEGGGAAAAAPGFRKVLVDGAHTEVIGAIHAIQTPGSLKWTTLGASAFDIGGSHTTAAARVHRLTMAASADTASATKVTAKSGLGRNVKTAHTLKAGGAAKIKAGGPVGVKAKGAMSIQVAGAMSVEGGTVVFEVPGASVSVHGGGVTLSAPEVVINGKNVHSGKDTTS